MLLLLPLADQLQALPDNAIAFSGKVFVDTATAAEGVLIIAQKEGGAMLMSVASDAVGHFQFPRRRMASGRYRISIRAPGFALAEPQPAPVTVADTAVTELQLKLRRVVTAEDYSRPDRQGKIWVSSTGSDRLLRLDPGSGEVTQFLMPVSYDARKVVADDNAEHTTIWLPNKNAAQLIRVEILQ